jgi:MFS family permease
LIILGTGFVLFSQIRELWQLYVVFFIMSLGASMCSYLPMMTVVNNWFVRYKARAMALAMEGFAVGGIMVPFLLAWSIGGVDPDISERYGWRSSALFIGILCLALAVPLSRLVRNRPEDLGLKPDGAPAVVATDSSLDTGFAPSEIEEGGYTWREAIRSKAFWLIALGHASTGTALGTIIVHLGLLLDDRGFSLHTISAVVVVYAVVQALLIPLGGYLSDKLSLRLLASGFSALFPVSVVVLMLADNIAMVFLFAVLWGVAWGGRNAVMSPLRGAYFGRRAFATITGLSMVPGSISMFTAPVFAGFMRDATGTYDVSFLAIAGISAFGSILFLLMGEPPRLSAQTARSSQAGG